MKNGVRRLPVVVMMGLGAGAIPAVAKADDRGLEPPRPVAPPPGAESGRARLFGNSLTLGVGLFGGGGMVALDKPSNRTVSLPDGRTGIDATYPGFIGATYGGGLSLDLRAFRYVGLEADLFVAQEQGKGELSSVGMTIGQSALHVPVLVKGVLDLPAISPFIGVGPEFVLPGRSNTEVEAGLATSVNARADAYTLVVAAIGIEGKLPIRGIDLRVPFSLRAGLNPATSNSVADRRDVQATGNQVTSLTYKSEFQYQVLATLGVSAYF